MSVKQEIMDVRAADAKETSVASDLRDLRLVLLLGFTIVTWVVFHFFLTDGFVLTQRNLSTLSVQMAVTAILAMGMTLLLVAREIDLSAGAVMALIMVAIFQCQVKYEIGTWETIVVALAIGTAVGALHGIVRISLGIPSFIITLAGFSWIRGVAFIIPDGQTLSGASEGFYAIANSEVPPVVSVVLIATIGAISGWGIVGQVKQQRGGVGITRVVNAARVGFLFVFLAGALWVFSGYRGLPYPTVLLLALATLLHAFTRKTDIGRYVYAIGGNPEAAKRVGIAVPLIVVSLFVLMGLLTAVAAIIQSSLLDAAPPGIGELLALNAISAAIIGGTNLFGGQGTIPGAIAGAMLMASISNGLSLAGVNTFYQMVATGIILLFAVGLDSLSRRGETRI